MGAKSFGALQGSENLGTRAHLSLVLLVKGEETEAEVM